MNIIEDLQFSFFTLDTEEIGSDQAHLEINHAKGGTQWMMQLSVVS